MELLLKIPPLENYEIRGKPDYLIEREGMVIEFKDGQIYTIDVYDPEVAKKLRQELVLVL